MALLGLPMSVHVQDTGIDWPPQAMTVDAHVVAGWEHEVPGMMGVDVEQTGAVASGSQRIVGSGQLQVPPVHVH
jgi:hypothetical protein